MNDHGQEDAWSRYADSLVECLTTVQARVDVLEDFIRDWLNRPNPSRDDFDAVAKALLGLE